MCCEDSLCHAYPYIYTFLHIISICDLFLSRGGKNFMLNVIKCCENPDECDEHYSILWRRVVALRIPGRYQAELCIYNSFSLIHFPNIFEL